MGKYSIKHSKNRQAPHYTVCLSFTAWAMNAVLLLLETNPKPGNCHAQDLAHSVKKRKKEQVVVRSVEQAYQKPLYSAMREILQYAICKGVCHLLNLVALMTSIREEQGGVQPCWFSLAPRQLLIPMTMVFF